jgi:hypothetical protein
MANTLRLTEAVDAVREAERIFDSIATRDAELLARLSDA